jgi:hypothetical protein
MPHKPSRRTSSNYSKQPFLRTEPRTELKTGPLTVIRGLVRRNANTSRAAYVPKEAACPPLGISWGCQSEATARSDSVPLSMLRPRLTSANHTVISR